MGNVMPVPMTDLQRAALDHLVNFGGSISDAASHAGYSGPQALHSWLRSKNGALALQAAMAEKLASGAPVMFNVLREIATNKAAPAGARVDAAKAWLDRAGFQVPRQTEKANDGKALHEMTAEELKRTVLELRAQEAKDVSPKPDDPDGLFD